MVCEEDFQVDVAFESCQIGGDVIGGCWRCWDEIHSKAKDVFCKGGNELLCREVMEV